MRIQTSRALLPIRLEPGGMTTSAMPALVGDSDSAKVSRSVALLQAVGRDEFCQSGRCGQDAQHAAGLDADVAGQAARADAQVASCRAMRQ